MKKQGSRKEEIDFMTELILKGHNQNALDKLEKKDIKPV